MKKSLIVLAFSLFALPIWAQFELKTSPVALLFPDAFVMLGAEVGINSEIGVDADVIVSTQGEGGYVNLAGKYYFNPKVGLDKFHAGVFLGVGEVSGAGFLAGYKWVSRRNIIFELGLGIGRGFSGDDAVGYGKLHIGYRFRGPKSQAQ